MNQNFYLGTELLFYKNNKQFSFSAEVTSCFPFNKGYGVVLNRTAFFFEGGGQRADEGILDGQTVRDVQKTEYGIVHIVDLPIQAGKKVKGVLNKEIRLGRMINHSGEHIVSGAVFHRFGYSNVGFHMSEHSMDVDFNGNFTAEELIEIEREVNRIVRQNLPVLTYFPSVAKLKTLHYRSKLELDAPRIVEIKGYDFCACCAPHVSFTGEIGYIKITEAYRNRNNTRLTLLCGKDAVEFCANSYQSACNAAVMLSAKPMGIAEAVKKQSETLEKERKENAELKHTLAKLEIAALKPTNGYLFVFCQPSSSKEVLNAGINLTPKGICVFCANESGYTYSFAATQGDIRPVCAELNKRLNGKGGGKPLSAQGRVACDRVKIEEFFAEINKESI